jgi:hypothetical protein
MVDVYDSPGIATSLLKGRLSLFYSAGLGATTDDSQEEEV